MIGGRAAPESSPRGASDCGRVPTPPLARVDDVRRRCLCRGARPVELHLRDDLLRRQLLHASEILARLHLVGARGIDLSGKRRALSGRLLDHRLRLSIRSGATSRRARSGKIRLGLRDANAILGRVDLHEQRIGLHMIVVADVDQLDVPAHLRENGNEVTVDRGVVSRLVHATVTPLLERPECAERGEQNDYGKDDAAFAGFRRGRRCPTLFDLCDVFLQCCSHGLDP